MIMDDVNLMTIEYFEFVRRELSVLAKETNVSPEKIMVTGILHLYSLPIEFRKMIIKQYDAIIEKPNGSQEAL